MTTQHESPRFELDGDLVVETLDALQEGLQILSPEWRYLYVNAAGARHGRRSREELLGKTMFECYPGIERTHIFSVLSRCMKERRTENLENEFEFPDGQRGWFELRMQPCRQGLIVLSLDITERKHLEEALREGQRLRALGRMAAGVVHDLKNILHPLAFGAELLREQMTDELRGGEEVLTWIGEALRTGNAMLERLRNFGRQEPERPAEPTDLNRVADAAVALCTPLFRMRHDVELRRERGETPPVSLPGAEMITAIVNLLVNSLDALTAPGTITLSTGADDGAWIEVADSGPGMSEEVARRVFEPFFTTKAHGTGLGLAQVQALVQRYGGRVLLDTAEGRGTKLRIWFPIASAQRPVQP